MYGEDNDYDSNIAYEESEDETARERLAQELVDLNDDGFDIL